MASMTAKRIERQEKISMQKVFFQIQYWRSSWRWRFLDFLVKVAALLVRMHTEICSRISERPSECPFRVLDLRHQSHSLLTQRQELAKTIIILSGGRQLKFSRLEVAWQILDSQQKLAESVSPASDRLFIGFRSARVCILNLVKQINCQDTGAPECIQFPPPKIYEPSLLLERKQATHLKWVHLCNRPNGAVDRFFRIHVLATCLS